MKAVMVMFDTLSRRALGTYNPQMDTPNFSRLEEKCTVFDGFYCGSMPCMPARRELHTGRYNFLHRGWGPLEPFDHSIVQQMSDQGIYTHLCTDHSHYFEDGGATYHNRYNTWEGFRGQEGDRWQPRIHAASTNTNPNNKAGTSVDQHYANRTQMVREEDMPSVKTMQAGIDFLKSSHDADNWFLQIECFDPHEPFYVPDSYRQKYTDKTADECFYWPKYAPSNNLCEEDLKDAWNEYRALIDMCDFHLGRILDVMDELNLWEDTMLIVNTDHGFMLGEHGFMGKNYMPPYEEVSHTPFYLYDPRHKECTGRRSALAQTMDIPVTLAGYFGVDVDVDVDGRDLEAVLTSDRTIHEHILYGMHGGHTALCDGIHTYYKAPEHNEQYLFERTLMPTNIRGYFSKDQMSKGELVQGDRFTNGIPFVKYPGNTAYLKPELFGTLLFNLQEDPMQESSIRQKQQLKEMDLMLVQALQEYHAPVEEYYRLGLEGLLVQESETVRDKQLVLVV